MNKLAVFLVLCCACGAAQEPTNFGYSVMAPRPDSNASNNPANAPLVAPDACSAGSVTVTSPQNGQQVNSPVTFKAAAIPASGLTIVQMHIYIDGALVHSVTGAVVNTALSVSGGTHNLVVTATESSGATLSSATTAFTVNTGGTARFQGCVYNHNGKKYQAVAITLNQPGAVTFDANLYYGATCNPSNWADEFGFGQTLTLGGFTYYFWFTDFSNQLNMSAIWKIDNQTSGCVNYATAPPC